MLKPAPHVGEVQVSVFPEATSIVEPPVLVVRAPDEYVMVVFSVTVTFPMVFAADHVNEPTFAKNRSALPTNATDPFDVLAELFQMLPPIAPEVPA